MLLTTVIASLVGTAVAVGDKRTFAVLRHHGDGPLMDARLDPIVNPGTLSGHVHTVMGASNFNMNSTGESLRKSQCTTALIKGDLSAYWFPRLYFEDPKDGHFEPVEMFYMNVYYFFEATNDKVVSFPVGLKMLSGDAMTRDPPNRDGTQNLDPSKGKVNPLQWTCPRGNFNPPSWPANSDGSKAGIQDPRNEGSGVGFPFANCDGYASPLRMDLHFPSCYNPAAGLENYKSNMAFPSDAGDGKQDCPKGWTHVPHIFYEVYWNTPKFQDRWTQNAGSQPFVLSNGDRSGYSGHGDFISGWDESVLQKIIDTCDAGSSGMDKCPIIPGGLNDNAPSCNAPSPVNELTDGKLTKLPGDNPISGWGVGSAPKPPVSSKPATTAKPDPTTAAAPTQKTTYPVSNTKPAPKPNQSTADAPNVNTKVVDPEPTKASVAPTTEKPAPTEAPEPSYDSTSTVWDTITEWKTTTVYVDAKPTAAPGASQPAIAGFKYAGCFKDASDRTLAGEIRPNLGRISNTLCIEHCKSAGFALAGTEYGGQCYCGNELVGSAKQDEALCDMPCEGDAEETCGGGWSLSVYSADGTAKAKRHLHNHLHNHRRGPSVRRG